MQFINQCSEMSKATPEHLENIIKLKKLEGMLGRLAIIWLYQKSGLNKTLQCLESNNIPRDKAKDAVKRTLGINSILLSTDRQISMMREAGTRLLDEL